MKKTLALIFVGGLLPASAATTSLLPSLTDESGSSTIQWISANSNTGWKDSIGGKTGTLTADDLKTDLLFYTSLQDHGWHASVANIKPNGGIGSSDISSVSETGFKFTGRQNYSGEFVMATSKLSTVLTSSTDTLTSLSISFDAMAGTNGISFSVWSWDGETATSLVSVQSLTATTSTNYSYTVNDLSLTASDSIVVVWANSSGGASNTISNLSSSFEFASIPESTTASLSLLGLATMMLRRRRV